MVNSARKAYRFVAEIPGIDPWHIQKVEGDWTSDGVVLTVSVLWIENEMPAYPTANRGRLKIVDEFGNVTLICDIAWKFCVSLPCQLDYTETTMITKIKLLSVSTTWWRKADDIQTGTDDKIHVHPPG